MKIKIPSKTFLWGEYVSLIGGSAGVLTATPYFELMVDYVGLKPEEKTYKFRNNKSHAECCILSEPLKNDFASYFHPDSPAGLILKNLSLENNPIEELSFFDPYNLKGGFGRSTAEFIVASVLKKSLQKIKNFENKKHKVEDSFVLNMIDKELNDFAYELWQTYRSLFELNKNKPSGYDLLAQSINLKLGDGLNLQTQNSTNHISVIEIENDLPKINNRIWDINLNVLLFKTNIKINTHEHLKALALEDLEELKLISSAISSSYLNKDRYNFITNLKVFDSTLKELNYKNSESLEICKSIMTLETDLYARGCGALGADVIAVFYTGADSGSLISKIQSQSDLIFIADIRGID